MLCYDCILVFLSFLFTALLATYGSSQDKGVKSALQLPAYTIATATLVLSHICNACHSLWQHWILNPLSQARD